MPPGETEGSSRGSDWWVTHSTNRLTIIMHGAGAGYQGLAVSSRWTVILAFLIICMLTIALLYPLAVIFIWAWYHFRLFINLYIYSCFSKKEYKRDAIFRKESMNVKKKNPDAKDTIEWNKKDDHGPRKTEEETNGNWRYKKGNHFTIKNNGWL